MIQITGKNEEDINATVLIDNDLWKFLIVGRGTDQQARGWVKELIERQKRLTNSQLNRYVKIEIYKYIAKPWIARNLYESKDLY